jgi:hypothetical protein
MSDDQDQTDGRDHHAPDNDPDDDSDEPLLGEVPEGLDADLYSKHLQDLKREPAFGEAVLSFPDEVGGHHEVALHDVETTEGTDDGSNRTKILLRNGVIVVASGAVIAGAIAAVRYRRRHRSS